MSLYPHNARRFNRKLFVSPTREYRGAPFWAWNARLNIPRLLRQIDCLKEMGMGGFHMHSRIGLDTQYLGDEFMAAVKACVAHARKKDMLAWLYDEDRWPSGFAGGLVTRNHAYRCKYLALTVQPCEDLGRPLARYVVTLKDGRLASYRRLGESEKARPDNRIWSAYLKTAEDSPWYNNQAGVDPLNAAAIRQFLNVTHERYATAVGRDFGGIVPAIFTDEPQYRKCVQTARRADDDMERILPWTMDYAQTFERAHGFDIFDRLPEVFWERGDRRVSVARYRYFDHLAERFASAYADTLGTWCGRHGLALTGHLMGEATLTSQVTYIGEAMRSYRSFHIPGVDILCDDRELTTVKQAQSVAHQKGADAVLSELYGVTRWDYDFAGHKAQGDWQAALGVTVRVHHLAWLSMAGEAKRDFPAPIDEHSPWYREYPLIENHFARVNTAMTRGRVRVRVGVIHPIESFWLCFGPIEQTKAERNEREKRFKDLTEWMAFGQTDFDFISEALLPSQNSVRENKVLKVGRAQYQAVIVPNLRTIRASTLDRLEAFHAAGGCVIFAGDPPLLVDAKPSTRALRLAKKCVRTPFQRGAILDILIPLQDVRVIGTDGTPVGSILYQLREDGRERFIFFCHTDRSTPVPGASVAVKGKWQVDRLNTLNGRIEAMAVEIQDGWTVWPWNIEPQDSLLIRLRPGKPGKSVRRNRKEWRELSRLSGPVPVSLSEPNVLLLDMAEWALDQGPWQAEEEILRLDHQVRKQLGWTSRGFSMAQPWTETEKGGTPHRLKLKFKIRVDHPVRGTKLAMEELAGAAVRLDNRSIPVQPDGWYVDEAIRTMPLPRLDKGTHSLVIEIPFGPKTNPEWGYLLGDFGVTVTGRIARITAPLRELAFSDWTRQGLPFYGGNVIYHAALQGTGENLALLASQFHAPLLTIDLDGKRKGAIAWAPHRVELGKLSKRTHRLDMVAFGSRINTFGAMHNVNPRVAWHGPWAWRTEGDRWSYEYQLTPCGLFAAPLVMVQ